jgi:hypothetical protein
VSIVFDASHRSHVILKLTQEAAESISPRFHRQASVTVEDGSFISLRFMGSEASDAIGMTACIPEYCCKLFITGAITGIKAVAVVHR